MNKKIVITLIFIFGLSLSACGTKKEAVDNKRIDNNTKKVESVKKNSLMDWLKGGKTVECKIKTPEGEIVVKTKGQTSYMEGVPSFTPGLGEGAEMNNNGVVLTVGDWTYMWDKITKKGTKMNIKEMEDLTGGALEEEEAVQGDFSEMTEEWSDMEYEYDCKEIKADDSIFKAPKDVQFEDMNEKMRSFKDQSKRIQEQAASGGQIDQEELEKMIQGLKQ